MSASSQTAPSPEFTVVFDRIGRHGGRGSTVPAPQPLVLSFGGQALVDEVVKYARRFLGSPTFDVEYDQATGQGSIYAGFRAAGAFTVTSTAGDAR